MSFPKSFSAAALLFSLAACGASSSDKPGSSGSGPKPGADADDASSSSPTKPVKLVTSTVLTSDGIWYGQIKTAKDGVIGVGYGSKELEVANVASTGAVAWDWSYATAPIIGIDTDIAAGSVGAFASTTAEGRVILADSAGSIQWWVGIPGGLYWSDIAVRGHEITAVARSEHEIDVGCSTKGRGVFLARFADGKCANVVT